MRQSLIFKNIATEKKYYVFENEKGKLVGESIKTGEKKELESIEQLRESSQWKELDGRGPPVFE